MKKRKSVKLRSAKIRITKFRRVLWECYSHLQEIYGMDDDDFLTGCELNLTNPRDEGIELKRKLKKIFTK